MEVELNTVVDKISEKIGIAVTQLKPVAEEVITQYKMKHTVNLIGFSVGILLLLAMCILCFLFVRYKTNNNRDNEYVIAGALVVAVVFLIMFPIFLVGLFGEIGSIVSPLDSILGF